MFGSNRSVVIAIAGLALLSGGVWFGLDQQALYQQEADQRHSDYSRRAADQIQGACTATPAPQKPDCIEEAVSEYSLERRNNRREYDDLVAQKTSALWTSIMGVAALIGMFLSAVGVALVYTTFAEAKKTNRIAMRESARSTRRAISGTDDTARALVIADSNAQAVIAANEIARVAGQRQLRPWLLWSSYDAFHFQTDVNARNEAIIGILVKLKFINAGRTPAIRANIEFQLKGAPADGSVPFFPSLGNEVAKARGEGVVAPGITIETSGIAIRDAGLKRFINDREPVFLYAKATYRDPADPNKELFTEACLEFVYDGQQVENGVTIQRYLASPRGPQNNLI